MRDKFIALDKEKAEFLYTLIRSINAKTVVEVGTSFGVSTIYLALAVGGNVAADKDGKVGEDGEGKRKGKVTATENEPSKATKAREYWKECGEDVENVIELREGDCLETLLDFSEGESVDLVLLDIWPPVALPALKLLKKNLRRGAVVVADNTVSSAERLGDLLRYLRDPAGEFRGVTLPFEGGLEMCCYEPRL